MNNQLPRRKPRVSEPPTVRPPFDPASFARDSDSRLRIDSVPPSARPTVPPALALAQAGATLDRSGDVPALSMAREDLEWFEVTPLGRALLVHVNGRDSVVAIATRTTMDVEDVVRELEGLARDGVVTWR